MLFNETHECGGTALLYVFFGITASIFGFLPIYAILFLLVFLFLWLFEAFGPPFLEMMLHYGIGLTVGVLFHALLPTAIWLPKRLFSNFGSAMFVLAELAFIAVAFVIVDVRIPETNWPVGFLVSFVAYTGWFIIVYIVNYSHYSIADLPYAELVVYNCTHIYWHVTMLAFYFAFALCVFEPMAASMLGALLNIPVALYLRYISNLGRNKN